MTEPNLVRLGVSKPLSFAYLREADSTELAAIERLADENVLDAASDLREIGWAMAQAVATLLMVGPMLYIFVLAAEAAGLHGLNRPQLWQAVVAGWLAFFAIGGILRIYRRRRRAAEARSSALMDMHAGQVQEEAWRFIEAIAFQEAEKMPFLYALHADNGMVVVLDEVVLRGADKDCGIAAASIAPADAVMIRAPHAARLLSASYSGPTLTVQAVYPLPLPPEARPRHGAILSASWPDVPQLFGAQNGRLL